MLDVIKLSLRLTSDAYDKEIEFLIKAAEGDLLAAGIDVKDILAEQAIILYVKGHFDFAGDGERYLKAYESLKTPLRLTSNV